MNLLGIFQYLNTQPKFDDIDELRRKVAEEAHMNDHYNSVTEPHDEEEGRIYNGALLPRFYLRGKNKGGMEDEETET
jgi:hypothetical protein